MERCQAAGLDVGPVAASGDADKALGKLLAAIFLRCGDRSVRRGDAVMTSSQMLATDRAPLDLDGH